MKNFKLTLILALLAVSNIVMASNNDPKPTNSEVSKQLSLILGTPSFRVSDNDMLAKVHFMVNKKSELIVLTVTAENEMVEDYIKSRMNYEKINNSSLEAGKEYLINVRIVAK
ncbi:hypothetical protein [Joostella sp.]|uniref:hypothetical protein n=1 Tax=Joostella sp. TaxID=2231138 RepID=UPI003A9101C5